MSEMDCGFCGEKGCVIVCTGSIYGVMSGYRAECGVCGARGRTVYSAAEAMSEWGRAVNRGVGMLLVPLDTIVTCVNCGGDCEIVDTVADGDGGGICLDCIYGLDVNYILAYRE